MGCAAIGALCLRTPDNAAAFVANGFGQLVVDILKIHKLKVGVEVIKIYQTFFFCHFFYFLNYRLAR